LIGTASLVKSPGFGDLVPGVPADTVVLCGANDCSGATIDSEGTLQLGSAVGLSGASCLIVNGGTLDLNGFGTAAAPVATNSVTMTCAGGAILSSAASPSYSVLAANSYVFAPALLDPNSTTGQLNTASVSVVLADAPGTTAGVTVVGPASCN